MANRLITEGIIEDYKNKECELFSKDCQITQCFNCYQYSHVGKTCQNQTRCGHCAEAHSSHSCKVAGLAQHRKCIVCKKDGHQAWSPKCKTRAMQRRRVHVVYESRPRFYTVVSRQNTLLEPELENSAASDTIDTPDTAMKDTEIVIPETTAQPLQEITGSLKQPATELKDSTFAWERKAMGLTAIPRKSIRRSRSAFPIAQDPLASPERGTVPQAKPWSETIMNKRDKLREKAYAKPARGRPKKIILADTSDNAGKNQNKNAL